MGVSSEPTYSLSKREQTRLRILEAAFESASVYGLESLTIGSLARDVKMSKSGLFAHFNSRENLQIAVVHFAGDRFVERVISPIREADHASIEAKLQHLLRNWMGWHQHFQGQCLFLDAWHEQRASNDPIHQALQHVTRQWLDYLAAQFEKGKQAGEFRADLDTWQAVYQLYGHYLSSQLFLRLSLESPEGTRFWHGVEQLLAQSRRECSR
ncbi:transcriptional regulator [Salinivibrio sp. SS3]|uniref:TetR/AcrR family transcriptional regulator n=1 Tax=Salinivibrio sp. SS3 TaxID=1895021 RepID=UPI0008481561|nr:TetR/AcrR family transcriptional regulator [Salinivibrio sp. BNH]ODP96183.1 transcriptional regulator [Salinivibrio sp. BNH]